MNFRKKKTIEAASMSLPLVALLDVIFFMLLYFMAAGTLVPPEAELPSSLAAEKRGAGGAGSDFSTQILRVEVVGGKAQFRLGDQIMTDRGLLLATLSKLPKAPGIIIKVDNEATVAAAALVLQAARDAGFVRISYVAG